MDNTIVQTPVSRSLRDSAAEAAIEEGFGSLQDAIRMFMHRLSKRELSFTLGEKPVILSKKAGKRYDKMVEEVLTGKVKTNTAHSVEELMTQLHAN